MRVLLCILVVVTHILTQYTINLDPDDNQLQVLYWIRNILIVATPGFIILSVMLTTLNYKTQLPKGYMRQRIKYLLIPYILIGLFYSFSEATQMDRPLLNEFISNVLLGNWYGYFILVIMQFIILNKIIYKIKPDLFKSKNPCVYINDNYFRLLIQLLQYRSRQTVYRHLLSIRQQYSNIWMAVVLLLRNVHWCTLRHG